MTNSLFRSNGNVIDMMRLACPEFKPEPPTYPGMCWTWWSDDNNNDNVRCIENVRMTAMLECKLSVHAYFCSFALCCAFMVLCVWIGNANVLVLGMEYITEKYYNTVDLSWLIQYCLHSHTHIHTHIHTHTHTHTCTHTYTHTRAPSLSLARIRWRMSAPRPNETIFVWKRSKTSFT
jgi:hypothetical protein